MDLSTVTLHVPQKNKWSGRLDFCQMLSGIILALFIMAHMLFVSSVAISPALMTSLAGFFESTYMAQVGGPAIFALMIGHFLLAGRKMPFKGPELQAFRAQSQMMHHMDTTLWLVQVVTALIILVMGSVHMFVILMDLPITAVKSATHIQEGGWLPFYVVLFAATAIHLIVGLYRIGVKYGVITRANRLKSRKVLIYLFIAFAVISSITHIGLSYVAI
jgi:fumarate reductase subunit C